MKKSSFLTFCFAFIPGAGEMYLGMMRKGAAIMTLFWGIIGISVFLQMGFICAVLPIIWFYSFFETFNIRWLPPEEIERQDQEFSGNWGTKLFSSDLKAVLDKRHTLIGILLILVGGWAILNNFFVPILEEFLNLGDYWIFRYLSYRLPSILVAFAVVVFGVHLVRGKKKPKEEDYVEFRGDLHD